MCRAFPSNRMVRHADKAGESSKLSRACKRQKTRIFVSWATLGGGVSSS
jgi:hypothetical protein